MKNALARVLPGVKKCSLCHREFCNTQEIDISHEKEASVQDQL